jgi:hypothetical protein
MFIVSWFNGLAAFKDGHVCKVLFLWDNSKSNTPIAQLQYIIRDVP